MAEILEIAVKVDKKDLIAKKQEVLAEFGYDVILGLKKEELFKLQKIINRECLVDQSLEDLYDRIGNAIYVYRTQINRDY